MFENMENNIYISIFNIICISILYYNFGFYINILIIIYSFITYISEYGNQIAVISDVEGNLDFLIRSIKISPILKWNKNYETIDFTFYGWITGSHFVFLGDSIDKSTGDIKVLRALILFKKKYMNNVHFIIGNRDINKYRMAFGNYSELEGNIPEDQPFWVPKNNRVTFNDYLVKINKTLETCTKMDRLCWMLEFTMGAKGQEENRRKELARIYNKDISDISDDQVIKSFVDLITPSTKYIHRDCYLHMYNELGKIAIKIGKTVFIHGAITKDNIGKVPNSNNIYLDVNEWFPKLNEWKDTEILNFKWGNYPKDLLNYALPNQSNSVMYANYCGNDGNPVKISKSVENWAKRNDITKIISGHKPHGDSPLPIKTENQELWVLVLDISYSDKFRNAIFSCIVNNNNISIEGFDKELNKYTLFLDHNNPTNIGNFHNVRYGKGNKKEYIIKRININKKTYYASRFDGYVEDEIEIIPE